MNKNVYIFTYTDCGGAGRAVLALSSALLRYGYNTQILVKNKTTDKSEVRRIKKPFFSRIVFNILNRIERKLKCFDEKYCYHDNSRYWLNQRKQVDLLIDGAPEIVILTWISRLIDIEILKYIKEKYNPKFYWMMTDMAPLTGGCHYFWDCRGYMRGCSTCPASNYSLYNPAKKNIARKISVVQSLQVKPIVPVMFLSKIASESLVFRNIDPLLYVGSDYFDRSVFFPGNDKKAKRELNLNEDKMYILYGASSIGDERKGFNYFIDALKILCATNCEEGISLLTIGNDCPDLKQYGIMIDHVNIGYVCDDNMLANVYRASKVLISPVQQDLGPAILVQAMMCGTPAVTFPRGIAIDLVIDGISGVMASKIDPDYLANGILFILKMIDLEYDRMSKEAYRIVNEYYSEDNDYAQLGVLLKDMES